MHTRLYFGDGDGDGSSDGDGGSDGDGSSDGDVETISAMVIVAWRL